MLLVLIKPLCAHPSLIRLAENKTGLLLLLLLLLVVLLCGPPFSHVVASDDRLDGHPVKSSPFPAKFHELLLSKPTTAEVVIASDHPPPAPATIVSAQREPGPHRLLVRY